MDLVNWFSYSGRCIYCNPLLNVSYWYVYIYKLYIFVVFCVVLCTSLRKSREVNNK